MDLKPGDIIHNFRILRFIPGGGMGKVFEAEDELLGRRIAIKMMDPAIGHDEQYKQRFFNEARLHCQLQHPNIVQLITFFEEAGNYFMVLEFAPGITLRDLISQTGPVIEERTRVLLRQILLALQYAHGKGIIHRDIKPSNLMVNSGDELKVLDFGIARLMGASHLTSTGSLLGTPSYMSPEQVLGHKDITHRTDIFSTGIVLFELLTGTLPYSATTTNSNFLLEKEIVEAPLPNPRQIYGGISNALVSLVYRMTAKDPAQRPEIPEILEVLDKGVGSETSFIPPTQKLQPESAPVPKTEPPPLPPRRKRVGVAVFFSLLALATLAFGGWMFYRHSVDGVWPLFAAASEESDPTDEDKAQELADDGDFAQLMLDYPQSDVALSLLHDNGKTVFTPLNYFPFLPNTQYSFNLIRGSDGENSRVGSYTLNTGEHFSRLVSKNGNWVLGDVLPFSGDAQLLDDLERMYLGPDNPVNSSLVYLGGYGYNDKGGNYIRSTDSFIQIESDIWLGYQKDEIYYTKYLIYSTTTPVGMGSLRCANNYVSGDEIGSYNTGYGYSAPGRLLSFEAINSLAENNGILHDQEYVRYYTTYDWYYGGYQEVPESFTLRGVNNVYSWSVLYAEGVGPYVLSVSSYHDGYCTSAYVIAEGGLATVATPAGK